MNIYLVAIEYEAAIEAFSTIEKAEARILELDPEGKFGIYYIEEMEVK